MTSAGAPTVFIIDDDAAVRASIQDLLESCGLRSESFETAEQFLRSKLIGWAKLPGPGREPSRDQRSGLSASIG
jgi:hypothetical protein